MTPDGIIQLVQRFNDIIIAEAPLFVTGHNIISYDLPWVLLRGRPQAKRWTRQRLSVWV